ncbi:MAG TPA: FHA domain-containing protein [Planctomycetota bacterium]|nr:FHA domain-containing protein [Planctomycetota bacterium]
MVTIMAAIPVIIGLSGLATGEVYKLGPAADLVMGRSRECQISFQRFRAWLALSEVERRLRDHFNSAVSRKHLRVLTHGSLLTAENLSSTGTMIDSLALEGRRSYDLAQSPVLIRLGNAEERFRAELMDDAEADRRLAALPPIDVHRLPGVPSPADDPTPMANPTLPPVSRPGSW